jgi:hypothetical protein
MGDNIQGLVKEYYNTVMYEWLDVSEEESLESQLQKLLVVSEQKGLDKATEFLQKLLETK